MTSKVKGTTMMGQRGLRTGGCVVQSGFTRIDPASRATSLHRMGRNSRLSAFTLIELLLVLVILSVLAAVVVPKFTNRAEQAKQVAARTSIESLSTALSAYEVDNGQFPNSSDGLNSLLVAPASAKDWRGRYVEKIPVDPWGNAFVYVCPGTHNTDGFDLSSYGADGREGGTDDVTNWTDTGK